MLDTEIRIEQLVFHFLNKMLVAKLDDTVEKVHDELCVKLNVTKLLVG